MISYILILCMNRLSSTMSVQRIINPRSLESIPLPVYQPGDEPPTFDRADSGGLSAVVSLAESGDALAQNQLGNLYKIGYAVKRNLTASSTWYLRAAKQGLKAAQHNIGYAYFAGQGLSRNMETAISWFAANMFFRFDVSMY